MFVLQPVLLRGDSTVALAARPFYHQRCGRLLTVSASEPNVCCCRRLRSYMHPCRRGPASQFSPSGESPPESHRMPFGRRHSPLSAQLVPSDPRPLSTVRHVRTQREHGAQHHPMSWRRRGAAYGARARYLLRNPGRCPVRVTGGRAVHTHVRLHRFCRAWAEP